MMGFYERWIVPRLLDLAMRNRLLDHYRQQTIASTRGLVLEIGVGSGVNLPLYGPAVTRVVGLDPSSELLRLASKRAADVVIPVSLLRASAEHLPLADAVFDTIIMTWTLCSIPNPMAALTEMRRVLGPGGRLIFVEHGLSPEIRVARWQHRLTPCWRRIGGGCHLDREMDKLIRAAGIPNRCDRNRLHEGAETLDFHVSWFRDELILSAPGKTRHILMPDARQLLPADDKGECRGTTHANPCRFTIRDDSAAWPTPIPGGRRCRWTIARWCIPGCRADRAEG